MPVDQRLLEAPLLRDQLHELGLRQRVFKHLVSCVWKRDRAGVNDAIQVNNALDGGARF